MTPEKSQPDRFKAAAKEVGADTSDDGLDRFMGKLDLMKKTGADGKKKD